MHLLPTLSSNRSLAGLMLLAAMLGMAGGATSAGAQSASWASQLFVPAYPSAFLSEWERNPQNLTLSVAYFGTEVVDYRIEGVLRGGGRGELARAVSPTLTLLGGPSNEIYTGDDLLGWNVQVQEARAAQALRTGVIPEDDYEICVRVLSDNDIQLTESCTFFSVALPTAPQLLYPDREQGVSTFQPMFQWTPVSIPVDLGSSYRVTVVPLLSGQTPATALRANRPVHEELVDAPVMVYPVDALELQDGERYVWQVEALDGFGDPLIPGGLYSEMRTFTATSSRAGESWDPERGLPASLELIPGLATVTDLEAVAFESIGTGWLLNGPAWMSLGGPYGARARVSLEDLEVDDFAGALSVRGGGLRAQLSRPLAVESALPVIIRELEFEPGVGLTAGASLTLPGGQMAPLDGRLLVTLGGLFGTLSLDGVGEPVWTGGEDPVELSLTNIEVRFPGASIIAAGQARLFGGDALCSDLSAAVRADGTWSVSPLCLPTTGFAAQDEDGRLGIRVGVVSGTLSADLNAGTLSYELDAAAALDLAPGGASCSVRFDAALRTGQPVTAEGITARCDAARAAVDAGWVRLGLSRLLVGSVGYTPGVGFRVEASFDLTPELPALRGFELPVLRGVRIDANGIVLSTVALANEQRGLDLAGYGVSVSNVAIPAVTVPWSGWRSGDLDGFRVAFDAELALPGARSALPTCLLGALPVVRGGVIADGALTLDVDDGTVVPAGCRIALAPVAAPELSLQVEGWAGPVVVALGTDAELLQGVGVRGALRLPSPFVCDSEDGVLSLDGRLILLPNGRVSGAVAAPGEGCRLVVAGFELELLTRDVQLDASADGSLGVLTTGARLSPGGSVAATRLDGLLTVDLRSGAVLDGVLEIPGPIAFPFPAEDPVFVFELGSATLSGRGLRIDGRQQLVFPNANDMSVTFDEVLIAPDGRSIRSGTVLFDARFALEGGIDAAGAVAWRAVPSGAPFGLEAGFHVDLPARVSFGANGLEVAGEGRARLVYGGRDVTEMVGTFRDAFALGTAPVAVSRGYLDLSVEGRRLAFVDDAGFHPDLGILTAELVPGRLGLPSQSIAYLDLRDEDGTLRLVEEDHPDGTRLYTPGTETIPLVLPALALGGGEAPEVQVAVDIVVGSGLTLQVLSGQVTASVDPDLQPELDLSRSGIPFRIRSLTFGDPDASGLRWRIEGDPVVLGAPVAGGSATLELTAASRLAGQIDIPHTGTLALVPDSDALRFVHDRLLGAFDVSLPSGAGTWSLELGGALALRLDGAEELRVDATLAATPLGVSITELDVTADLPPVFFDAGLLELGVTNLRVPHLDWSTEDGWDFELVFDGSMRFPGLDGITTGAIADLRITPAGVSIPGLELSDINGAFDLAGFRVVPGALRLPAVQVDLFGAGISANWNPRFDLSVELGGRGWDRWPELAGFGLSALDVELGLDGFSGTLEPRALLTPISIDLAPGGLGLRLATLSGGLSVLDGVQSVDLRAGGSLVLPEALRCDASPDPLLELPEATLELFPGGGFGGRLEDLALTCPLRFGPLEIALTDADLVFAFVDDVQAVNVFADAILTLQGTAPNTTVSATGSLDVSLLEPAVIGGGITVDEPFRWQVPAEDPFLTLDVNQAVLDRRGFVLDGAGAAVLADGTVGPAVTFAGLTFDRHGDIVAGSATLAAGVALDGTVSGAGLSWSVADAGASPADANGFRLGLAAAATLDSTGLTLEGSATAQLSFADSSFAGLEVAFTDGFTLATRSTRVTGGRAGFAMAGTEIAFVDRRGFFPGDVFGVLPLPARLLLPTENVAYLEIRDPDTGAPLVQSTAVASGFSVSTTSGAPVSLVLPGLPNATGGPTVLPVHFDVVVNGASYALVSGTIDVSAPAGSSLFDLDALGLPLSVTRVVYDADVLPAPRLDLRVRLPGSLADVEVRFAGVAVTASGLQGEAIVGDLAAGGGGGAGPPVADAQLGELRLRVDGARAAFGANPRVTLAGGLSSGLFRDPSGMEPRIGFTATVAADGSLDLATDASTLPQGRFPIGEAYFEPGPVGSSPAVAVTATEQLFTLAFSGVLGLPNIATDLRVSLERLSVGSNGITLPSIALTGGLDRQRFTLFGAGFTLRDTDAGPGIGLGLDGRVLVLTLNGDLDFLGRSVEFEGLRVGTDGRLTMAGAALLGDPVPLVPGSVSLTALAVRNRALEAGLAIDLPAPFDRAGTQTASFSLGADGSVSGGGLITLLDEAQGLGGNRTQFNGAFATGHLRYLGLRIDPAADNAGSIEAVGDLYLANDVDNRIAIGSRVNQSLDPGLSIGLNGEVRWGSVTVSRSFDVDFDVLRLTVSQVSSSVVGGALGLDLGGTLQLDVPAATGGIDFVGFEVTPALGLMTDNASVQGGNITIAGMLSLSLSNFVYSATPTTLTGVRGGLLPTGTAPNGSATTTDIEVSSLLSFGGTVSVGSGCGSGGDCLFSGGVERFLFYRTAPEDGSLTHLVVRRASLNVANALTMEADLAYRQIGTNGGFEVMVGGRADFQAMEVTVVGALEHGGQGDMRAGLFLIASGRLEIIPVVLALTEIGGGFFYNPRPEYCQLVRQYSGVSDLGSNGSSCENAGRFTGFLFAGAELIERNIGRAQVLLTVSESGLQLDGQMALLSPGSAPIPEARIRGTLHLAVGFQELFAEGNIELVVDYDPLVTAGGPDNPTRLGFFVYGEDAWGVYGALSVSFLRLIRGNAEFFVGPPGFYIEGTIRAGFDFWIVSVDAYASTAVWFVDTGWGAYVDVGVTGELFAGIASASGQLRGALVSPANGSVLVYASALARGCLLGFCESAEIWAKFQNGSVSGGFGKNATFDQVIAAARAAKARFESEKLALESKIQAAQVLAGLALSEAELAEIYARIQEEDLAPFFGATAALEYDAYPAEVKAALGNFDTNPWWTTESGYYTWYRDLVEQVGSPQATLYPSLDSYYDRVAAGVQQLQNNRSIVELKLSQAMVEIEELEGAVDLPEIGGSPIVASNFDAPQTIDNGDGTRSLVAGPGVELDAAVAAEIRSDLQARQVRNDAYLREVARRIEQVEAGLGWIDYLLLDTASVAPLGFVRDYADVLQNVEEQYARHGDLLLRQQDWYRQRLQELVVQREPELQGYLHRKSLVILQNANDPEGALENLIQLRANALDHLSSTSDLSGAFIENTAGISEVTTGVLADYKAAADLLGRQLWYDIARVGMTVADGLAGEAFDSIRARADDELLDRWREHAGMTLDIHRAMDARADLMASLYDLYMEFGRVFPEQTTVTRTLSYDALNNPFLGDALGRISVLQDAINTYFRMQQLESQFQVPTIDHVAVVSQNLGYMAKETYLWEASHPAGIHEYFYNSIAGANVGFLGMAGMQSNGADPTREGYILTPGRGTTFLDRTLRVGARGGAGYVGLGRATYQTRFQDGGGLQPVGQGQGWGRTPDTTPPSTPSVRIGGHASSTNVYWTSRTDQIDSVRWSAIDLESGIGGYEYSIGSQFDTTSVRDWTDLGGRQTATLRDLDLSDAGPPEATATGETTSEATSPFYSSESLALVLAASEAAGYRVFVRARNGEGLTGAAGRSAPIRVDVTPPAFPDTARIRLPIYGMSLSTFYFLGGGDPVASDPILASAQPICAPPPSTSTSGPMVGLTVPISSMTLYPQATPVMTFQLPRAQDVGSGVARYAWRIGSQPATVYTATGWTETAGTPDTLRIEGPPLNYQDSLYFSLVAIDRVGHVSAPIHYGPFIAPDLTDPVGASFCATTGTATDRLRMRVSSGGTDPESGVAAWDYRIRRADGSVVRDWPSTFDRTELPDGSVIDTGPLPLVHGDRVYAEIRVTNGAGRSTVTASGPVDIFLTPPTAPVISTVMVRRSGSYVILSAEHRTDAQAGLTHRWYLVSPNASGFVAQGNLPGTGGVFRIQDIWVQMPDGTALPSGTYTLLMISTTSTGISSAEGSYTVTVP